MNEKKNACIRKCERRSNHLQPTHAIGRRANRVRDDFTALVSVDVTHQIGASTREIISLPRAIAVILSTGRVLRAAKLRVLCARYARTHSANFARHG